MPTPEWNKSKAPFATSKFELVYHPPYDDQYYRNYERWAEQRDRLAEEREGYRDGMTAALDSIRGKSKVSPNALVKEMKTSPLRRSDDYTKGYDRAQLWVKDWYPDENGRAAVKQFYKNKEWNTIYAEGGEMQTGSTDDRLKKRIKELMKGKSFEEAYDQAMQELNAEQQEGEQEEEYEKPQGGGNERYVPRNENDFGDIVGAGGQGQNY